MNEPDTPGIAADINYLAPGSFVNRRFVAPAREERLQPVPGEDQRVAAAIFRYNPAHRWWYFSNLTRDEVLLIVFHDSRRVRPWRVPHTAFRDVSRPDASPRASIEFRTVAYFA